MTPEPDYSELNSHQFEIPDRDQELRRVRTARRRRFAVVSAATCLGLAGLIVGAVMVRSQRASDEHVTAEALQREDLRDGWKALGAAASLEAQSANPPAPATPVVVNLPPAAPTPPAQMPNVVIVNVPPQGSQNVGVSSPGGTPQTNGYTAGAGTATPAAGYGNGVGYAPGSVPYGSGVNYGSGINIPSGTNSGIANSPSQVVGNGSIPGSTPNPALPNNGASPIAPPTPGLPNGSINSPPGGNSPTGNSPTGAPGLVGAIPAAPSSPAAPVAPSSPTGFGTP